MNKSKPTDHVTFWGHGTSFLPVSMIYHQVSTIGLPKGHEAHSHEGTIEICYIAKGRLFWRIGDTPHEIHAGDILVILPGVEHGSLDSTLPPCEYYSIHLDPSKLKASMRKAVENPQFGGHHVDPVEAADIVKQIYQEHSSQDRFSEDACLSLVKLLIVALSRHREAAADLHSEDYLIQRSIRILQQSDSPNLSVGEIAAKLGVSQVWMTRVFHKVLGQAPGQWIRSQRMEEAKRLLAQTNLSIIDIALQVGFESSQYFATAFRKETGQSPTEYRSNQRKK